MASLKADSELMTNYVAAVPVPVGSKFSALLDENRRVMVLSLSNDTIPKLQFIRIGADGARILVDMAARLNIPPTSIIETFCIRQANDLRLFMAASYKNGPNTSTLVITEPFMPEALKATTTLPLIPGGASIGQAKMIYMTPVNNLQLDDYPSLYAVHKTLDQTVSWGSDITEVIVRGDWQPSNRMSTPENVSEVLDIAPAANLYGKGLFVLYKSEGQSKLYARFLAPDPDGPPGSTVTFVTSVACPIDATCIESYWDPRNRSALLIGASEGIRMLSPSESVSKTASGVVISTDSTTMNIQDLVVAQDNNQLSLWFRNQGGDLCYLRAASDQLTQGTVVKLLPKGKASSFAACVAQPDPTTGQIPWQMLVSNDNNGNLTLLQQALDSGLWRPAPFYTPSNTENITIQSYTVTLKSLDAKGNPIKGGRMFLTPSSSVDLIENGRHGVLPESGRWFDIDFSGSVHLIVPTDTLASQALKIISVLDSSGQAQTITPLSFNPAQKAMDTLNAKVANINNADDLKNARTSSGKPVFDQALDSDTANASIAALKNLQIAYSNLPADGSIAMANTSAVVLTSAAPTSIGLGDLLGEGLHWIKEQAKSALNWFVKKIGEVWQFICTIAGEVKNFVLDCLEKVGEAFSWVFEKIKAGWDIVVEWVGFIFSWDDIIETKNTISSVLTAGIELGQMKVGDVAKTVDELFVGLLADVDNLMATVDGTQSLSGNSGSQQSGGESIQDTTSSTKFNWAGERLKNGGAGTSTQVVTSTTGDTDSIETWGDIFQPALEGIKSAIEQVGDDIKALFVKEGSITTADFMRLSKDVIKLGIQTIRGLVSSLLRLVMMLLQKIGEYGNAPIKIPIFSALYKLIAEHELTVFDAVSLILAIPTTIFMKLITGNKPPTLPGLNGNMLGQIVIGPSADGQAASPQMILDFNLLTGGIVVSGVMVSTIKNLLKFAYSAITGGVEDAVTVFKGPGGFLEVLSIIIDMIGTLHAMPTNPDLPGLEYRQWVARICLIRGATHLLHLFAGGGEDAEKALLVFDFISALVNFGLQQATSIAEANAGKTWQDYDDETTIVGSISSGLNAVAATGYFAAFMVKSEQPEIAAVGLVILEAGTIGVAVTQGLSYKRAYDRKKAALLLPSST